MRQGTRAAYLKIREKVPMIRKDEAISPYIQAVVEMVANGIILDAVEMAVGTLR